MSHLSENPMLAEFQEKMFILSTVALPLIAKNIELLNIDELDLIQDCIMDFGYIALKLDEIEMLKEALAQGE